MQKSGILKSKTVQIIDNIAFGILVVCALATLFMGVFAIALVV